MILTGADLRSLLSMRDVIAAIEAAFRDIDQMRAPERSRMDLPGGVLLQMPAFGAGAAGTKIVSVFEGNAARGLEVVQAVYLLLDPETGEPLALMEGNFLTAIRTAATSAVATKWMAAPGPKRLAIFGAGAQAEAHIEAMIEAAQVESIMIVSRTRERAQRLAERVRSRHNVRAQIAAAAEAVASANLICTCTTSSAPLFDGRLIRPGTHINAVGSFSPTARELDSEAVRRAWLIIDSHLAAGREAGDILIPISEGAVSESHIRGTLADVVSGRVKGRESDDQITIFKSCGLAIEDLAAAKLAYERALSGRIGAKVDLNFGRVDCTGPEGIL